MKKKGMSNRVKNFFRKEEEMLEKIDREKDEKLRLRLRVRIIPGSVWD